MTRTAPFLLCLALLVPACTTSVAPKDDQSKIATAATTPLSDLNLLREKIPKPLNEARRAPYAVPDDLSCDSLAAQVRALDEVLGPDLDRPKVKDDEGLIERGGEAVGDVTVGAVKGAAEGVVPLRSWVRGLTGAERNAKEVSAAVAAGTIRRSFLKGLGQAAGCAPPAAPQPGFSAR